MFSMTMLASPAFLSRKTAFFIAVLLVSGIHASGHATELAASPYSLMFGTFSGSNLFIPGEIRESRLYSERKIQLQPGLNWLTSTDLAGARHGQLIPLRSQQFEWSTGPQIKLGKAEMAFPLISGRESNDLNMLSSWNGSSPTLLYKLGTKDRISVTGSYKVHNSLTSSSTKKSASLSWRHALTESWAIKTGITQNWENGSSNYLGSSVETYASVHASLPHGWRWNISGSWYESKYGSGNLLKTPQQSHVAELSLSTKYELYDGWRISGTLSASQTSRSDAGRAMMEQSSKIKIYKEF